MKTKPSVPFSILVIIGCIAAVMISKYTCQDKTGFIIDAVAAICMAIIILIGVLGKHGLRSLDKAILDLDKITELVKNSAEDPSAEMETILDGEDIFTNPTLEQAYKNYRSECDRLYQPVAEYRYCDIADYINVDLLSVC